MTTLTVNINDKKTEKAIKAVLDAFGLDYNIDKEAERPLTKKEREVYNSLKKSLNDVKLYKEGKIKFQDAKEFLNEL